MNVQNIFRILAVSLLFNSVSAWPLGLGDARVQSFIGQPLELRIDLLTAPADDLGSVTARLATAEDFALIGANRGAISVPLSFSVREGEDGRDAYILVTSRLAIDEPVLRLVVEVNWSKGRLLREYTVFLDPPTVPARAPEPVTARSAGQQRPAVESEPATAPPQREAVPGAVESAAPAPAVAEDRAAEAVAPAEPAGREEIEAGGEYGPVRSGETLWRIASDYMGQSNMDRNRVMLAIQRKNPEAFLDDNINLLMRGATLEMPSAEDVEALSAAEARELVAQQEAAFRMRSSLASASTPLLASESRVEVADSTSGTAPLSADASADSRLEIVPASEEEIAGGQPGTGAVPGGEGADEVERDLREELARTEEELISERQQNEYLRERVNELEAQLSEAGVAPEGLIADDDMASLEDRLRTERLAEAQPQEAEPPDAVPSVSTTTPPTGEDRPWYSGPVTWIIMVVIVVAAFVGWVINRRRSDERYVSDMGDSGTAVAAFKGEAEEILRSLDADREEAEEPESRLDPRFEDERPAEAEVRDEDDWVREDEAGDEEEDADRTGDEDERPVVSLERARRLREDDTADAMVLDEDSSDPEIKLDLARAYISMGDKEAARVILDEVLNIGNDAQRSEARSMMDEL